MFLFVYCVGKEYGRKSGDKNIKILKGGKKGGISV
jgi:hypothetical protein